MRKKDILFNVLFPLIAVIIPNLVLLFNALTADSKPIISAAVLSLFGIIGGCFAIIVSLWRKILLRDYFAELIFAVVIFLCAVLLIIAVFFILFEVSLIVYIGVPLAALFVTAIKLLDSARWSKPVEKVIVVLLNPNVYFFLWVSWILYSLAYE